jgi:hypothetical protein
MMRSKINVYLLITILIISLVFAGVSFTYASMKMKLLPLIVCGLILILSAIELIKEVSNRKKTSGETKLTAEELEVRAEASSDIRGDMVGFAWFVGLIIAVCLIGFMISIPLFILVYLKIYGCKWRTAIITSIVMITIIYLTFIQLLQADLYGGIFFKVFS